jgi:hypothetical protein
VGLALLSIAILLALALTLLAVPITVVFRIDRIKEIKGQLSLRWLFGLVRFRVGIPGSANLKTQRRRKPAKRIKVGKPGSSARGIISVLKQAAFRRRVIRFIKDMLRAAHVRDLYLRLRIGLGDPADTGRLWALLGPFAGIAANLRSADVRIEPEFMDSVLEIESHGGFRLVPLQFIVMAVAFAVSPATLRAWCMLQQRNS